MSQLFISHVHEEQEVAKLLGKYLSGYGLKAFLSADNAQIRAGERWFDRIASELGEAKIVLLMLSPYSVSRPWINFEGGWAWAMKKVTIPVCFGGLDKGLMPRPYSDVQGIDLRANHYNLILDCCGHLNQPPPPPMHEDTATELISALDKMGL